jgi:hypothetical protein
MEIVSTEVSFTLYLEYRGEGSVAFDGLQIYYEPLNTRYSYSDVGQVTQISGPNQNITMTYEEGSVSSAPSVITDNVSGSEINIEQEEGSIEEVVVSNVASTPTYNSYGRSLHSPRRLGRITSRPQPPKCPRVFPICFVKDG